MSGFVFHPATYADLDEIWEFIAADSLDAAHRVLEEIYEAIRSLIVTSRPVRFHPVRDFLIACAPDENPLVVLAILHGRRNPRIIAAILRGRE